ncbi:hypothetical protein KIN20_022675 [Parelaphostrongylus tenuis]|uniref:Uncharacterized protein n=1 Tax=Parelaphostrongylus tenuis TaxID=148309 RepID=A0AAD5N5T0_PARTN|nr:hypothetical protein KIN20_022675 [Parelaphostrongylus tenuis]
MVTFGGCADSSSRRETAAYTYIDKEPTFCKTPKVVKVACGKVRRHVKRRNKWTKLYGKMQGSSSDFINLQSTSDHLLYASLHTKPSENTREMKELCNKDSLSMSWIRITCHWRIGDDIKSSAE